MAPEEARVPSGAVGAVNEQVLAVLAGEKQLLELVASGRPLPDVLEAMCRLVDAVVGNSVCSLLLVGPDGKFRHGAGPTLPQGYAGMVNGAPVVCEAGPCGTAASLKEQVIVPDLVAESRWVGLGWRTLVLEHGLKSVCSTPIVSLTGKVFGTFAIYHREPGPPSALLKDLIARFTHVASIAIERAIGEAALERSQARVRRLVDANIIGIFIWDLEGRILEANDAFLTMLGYDRQEFVTAGLRWTDLTPPEWRDRDEQLMPALEVSGKLQPFEKEYSRKDGSRVPVLVGVASFEGTGNEGVAYVLDLTERKRAEEALNRAGAELAHMSRVTALSALTASIAHEINQPLSGIITNAGTCLRMLDASPPDIDGARETARRTIRDGNRASDVIKRLRALFSKREFTLESLDLNELAREVIALWSNDLQRDRIVLQAELADDLPFVSGDRIQLQQVILNLVRNASEAMIEVDERQRRLLIKTERQGGDSVRLMVRDSGVGLSPTDLTSVFDAFYTTKSAGMGIGLFVSRSIIEKHHGRLWAEPNEGTPGAAFSFSIPHGAAGVSGATPE